MFWFLILTLLVRVVTSTDYMPCLKNVNTAEMALAGRLLEAHTPEGYRLTSYYPVVQTGINPHRCIGYYDRLNEIYRTDCDYLTDVRRSFRQFCPAGCEISQVEVSQSPNAQFIQVQILVSCRCTKFPRRRRSRNNFWQQKCISAGNSKFVHEKTTCPST